MGKKQSLLKLNKIGFSALASACIMNMLKRQRDAVGLSVYSDEFEFYAPERAGERHHHLLLNALENAVNAEGTKKGTQTYTYLHQIAEKLNRRSLVFLFTDMFQSDKEETALFEALRHLKYNKHEVVLFHVLDREKELGFGFSNTPKRFFDVETGDEIDLYSENIQENYKNAIENYFKNLKLECAKYRISYVPVDINKNFNQIL